MKTEQTTLLAEYEKHFQNVSDEEFEIIQKDNSREFEMSLSDEEFEIIRDIRNKFKELYDVKQMKGPVGLGKYFDKSSNIMKVKAIEATTFLLPFTENTNIDDFVSYFCETFSPLAYTLYFYKFYKRQEDGYLYMRGTFLEKEA